MIRFVRTVLPPTVVVFAAPVSPLMTPPAVAPTTVKAVVDRFWIETLPLSLDALILPVSEVLALMPLTISSTVCAVALVLVSAPLV